MLRVEDLVVEFPIGRTGSRSTPCRASASTCCRGETLGHRRRVGLRQEHHRTGDHAAPPPDVAARSCSRVRTSRRSTATRLREARTKMQMIFQDPISSLNPRRKVRDIVMEPLDDLEAWHARRTRSTHGRRGARGRRHRSRTRRREPAPPVLRRPVPAHLDRPRARARPDDDHLRRAGVGARRQRAGAGAQPARGPEGQVRADADLHRPRPRRREEHQRSGGGDVPRQAVRGGAERRPVRAARRIRYTKVLLDSIPVPDPVRRSLRHADLVGEPPSPVDCRRRGADSTHAARPPTSVCRTDEPQLRSMGNDHFVACHHPMETPVVINHSPATASAIGRAM